MLLLGQNLVGGENAKLLGGECEKLLGRHSWL